MLIVEFTEDYDKFSKGMKMHLENPQKSIRCDDSWFEDDRDLVTVTNIYGDGLVPKKVLRVIDKKGNKRLLRRSYTAEEKEVLLTKSNGRCACCGKKLSVEDATVEHMIPLSLGGGNLEVNLVALCLGCNKFKTDAAKDVSYFKYLGNKYKERIKEYMMLFKICNTKLGDCDFLLTDSEEVTLFSVKYLRSGGFYNTRMKAVPHTFQRRVRTATYADLDALYQMLLKEGYFHDSVSCKEYLSDCFSNGKLYILCNDDNIKAFFTVTMSQVGGYTLLCLKDIFFGSGGVKGDRVLALYSVLTWITGGMNIQLSLANEYLLTKQKEVSESVKLQLFDTMFTHAEPLPIAFAIECNFGREYLDMLMSGKVPVFTDTHHIVEYAGKLVFLSIPLGVGGSITLRDKDVVRKCSKLLEVQMELEKYNIIVNNIAKIE